MATEKSKSRFIRKCNIAFYRFRKSCKTKTTFNSAPFNALSPTDEAEGCLTYFKSINWALSNTDKIKNIAISGPYGSGKSSVINTYIKHYNNQGNAISRLFSKRKKFLNISLATFRDISKDESDDKDQASDTELQRLIELSILQQLFYHEKDNKLPDSRFKKIKKQSDGTLITVSILSILWLVAVLFILTPDFLAKFSIYHYSPKYTGGFRILASAYIILGLLAIVYKSSRSLIGASIKKLNIKSAEIEIDKGISKSILNNHLDEIIYFFEATKYNVVIIEDLDRFEQADIFTKLREINLLINNSRKIKDPVVFIYAIKDDMFDDKDRAKFFDFMIPIIPVINFSNSGEKIRAIVKANKYDISDDLIDDLSLFIDDMRLLHNIMNEFYIYSTKIVSNIIPDKLLAMIVYKNIFPYDFIQLSQNKGEQNKGELYKIISMKRSYIEDEEKKINEKIQIQMEKLDLIRVQYIKNKTELQYIYINYILNTINADFNITGIKVNNEYISIYDTAKSDAFDFYSNKIYCKGKDSWNSRREEIFNYNSKNIENTINPELSFTNRIEEAEQSELSNNIKKTIAKYREEIENLPKIKLKDLLVSRKIETSGGNQNQNQLISILLRNGYIDENYLDYISIFHEGELTKPDYQFLINVKIDSNNSYDYKLYKIEELLKKLNEFTFEHPSIFNFDLLDYMLESENHSDKKNKLFEQLSNESDSSFEFINQYMDNSGNIETFIKTLCSYWNSMWTYLSNSRLDEERKDRYFRLMIKHGDIDNLFLIFSNHTKYLNSYSNLLSITDNDSKIKRLISDLHLKFNKLSPDSPKELLQYVFNNNHYAISINMLTHAMKELNVYKQEEFETKNYSSIVSSGNKTLIQYIKSELSLYIDKVFLRLDKNDSEELEHYVALLNSDKIEMDQIENIIKKTNTTVESLNAVDYQDVKNLLLKHNKVTASWGNVLNSFNNEDQVINSELINYLNRTENAEKLSRNKIPNTLVDDKLPYYKLCTATLNNKHLTLDSYDLLSKSSPWWYETFETENLSIDKIKILIKNSRVNPTINAYKYLKENFNGTNIDLLEAQTSKFRELVVDISFDSEDIRLLLKTSISKEIISTILAQTPDVLILENKESASILLNDLVTDKKFTDINGLIPALIIDRRLNVDNRIKLFIDWKKSVTIDGISNIINSFGGIYPEIIDSDKRALIPDTPTHRHLLDKLKSLGAISSYKEKEDKGLRVYHSTK